MRQTKRMVLLALLWLTCTGLLWAAPSPGPVPRIEPVARPGRTFGPAPGWRKLGSDPMSYEVGTDTMSDDGRRRSDGGTVVGRMGYVRSISPVPKGYATLAQECLADAYRGKKVVLSAQVKSQDVVGWGGLLIRVDDASGKALAFQNMQDHPIRGTSNWARYTLTFDVPHEGNTMFFGVLLQGTGQIWITSVNFEVVGEATEPPSALPQGVNPTPTNLDFQK